MCKLGFGVSDVQVGVWGLRRVPQLGPQGAQTEGGSESLNPHDQI
eukprot:CAMPEP_0182899874 /NCGR_PEP_ID=MMETSP0034_2-20130328/28375_1 /TAXON_ID=156128 /ORGANISM="Nephroselmis pyriformis, Strain CCMP717" /LENGTH=44 /DNA_ID= /DNA_START= /DNA_END= /DNA_ORIENTATION=